MDTLRKTLATLLVAVSATAAMAQSGVEEAISNFVESKGNGKNITASNYQEAQEADSLPLSYYHEYKFSVNKKNKQFEQLREAFDEGQCKYYKKAMKTAGEQSQMTWNVGYGARSEKIVSFGTHKERNYSLLYSRIDANPEWRIVYGLVWYDDTENEDTYKGSLHIICSPDPQKMERNETDTGFDWNGFSRKMAKLNQSLEGLDLSLNGGNITILDTDSLLKAAGITHNDGIQVFTFDTNKQLTTADQFLKRFGTLRALYLDSEINTRSASYRTGLVSKIVSLCKNKASLLSADEKEVCAYGIKEMQKAAIDEYDKRMLNVALKALK